MHVGPVMQPSPRLAASSGGDWDGDAAASSSDPTDVVTFNGNNNDYNNNNGSSSSNSNSPTYKKITRPVTALLDDLMNDHEDRGRARDDDPLVALESQQRELSSSLGRLKRSLEEEKDRSQALRDRLAEAERIIEEQNRKLERTTRSQFQELEALEAELKAQRQREEEKLRQEREQRRLQEGLLEQARAVAQAQQLALTEQVQRLQANLDAATRDSTETKREVDQVARELSSARNEISSLANRLQTAQSKEETYQGKMSKLEEKLNVARGKLAIKQQNLAKTQRDLAQAQSMLDLQDKLSPGSNGNSESKSSMDPSSIFSGSIWSSPIGIGGNNNNNNNAAAAPKSAPKKVSPVINQIPPPTPVKTFVYPFINNWSINPSTGEVTGIVRNHPEIADGTRIVTSALANPRMALANAVVVTRSGSKYQLGMPSRVLDAKKNAATPGGGSPASSAVAAPAPAKPFFTDSESSPNGSSNGNIMSPLNFFSGIAGGGVGASASKSAAAPVAAPWQQQAPASQSQQQPQLAFPLTGESISDGRGTKYLLAGRAKRKPSGRSEIIMAYRADEDFKPTGGPLVVKLSTHKHKLEAEYGNYEKIQRGGMGLLGGVGNAGPQPFVKCVDFLPRIEGSIKYAQHSALILEQGEIDLREYRASQTSPLSPALIKASLSTALKCMEAMHKARLVYTDIKAENFIIMDTKQLDGDGSNIVVKGVDLESAVPHRGNPIDYTPEASPPEFAVAFLEGEAHEFVLDYSYDVWSFGMLAYELATGRGHFGKKPPAQIIKHLGTEYFEPPKVDATVVADDKLCDLIQRCLSMDPKKRPTTNHIANHPYFRGEGVAMPRLFGW